MEFVPEATQMPTRRFTAAEVVQMSELGILTKEDRVELIDGELIVVSPQGPIHSGLASYIGGLLEECYGRSFHFRCHSPVGADADSLPEPDVALVRGPRRNFRTRYPEANEVLLIVEVAYSSQAHDRRKAGVYARCGVPTYWLIDVPRRRVEARSQVTEDGQYALTQLLSETDEVSLPELDRRLPVSELLPPAE